jgi:uncharacterized protein YwgA
MKAVLRLRISVFIFLLVPLAASAVQLEFKGIPMSASEADVRAKLTDLGISEIDMYPKFVDCYDTPKKTYTPFSSGDRACEYHYHQVDYRVDPTGKKNRITFAEKRVKAIWFSFYSDKLQRIVITMSPTGFVTDVVAALTAKYGKPSQFITEKLQNKFGANFDDATWFWRLKEGTIKAHLYASSDISTVEYFTKLVEEDSKQQMQNQGKEKAKDL